MKNEKLKSQLIGLCITLFGLMLILLCAHNIHNHNPQEGGLITLFILLISGIFLSISGIFVMFNHEKF